MRLCTYNIHMWADARGRSNTEAVMELLRKLDCDVVILNEVPRQGGHLARVARALKMKHAYGEAGFLGNAILSRHPLKGVERASIADVGVEARSALIATVDAPGGAFDVCATHLDTHHESARLAQLDRLAEALLGRVGPRHVVAGDFNALRLADYAPEELARVAAHRALGDREAPRGEVIARMDALGYVDALRWARAGGLDAYPAELARPLPPDELPTCWAGTRIDYLWASVAFTAGARPRACQRVESAASDHVPVVLDVDF